MTHNRKAPRAISQSTLGVPDPFVIARRRSSCLLSACLRLLQVLMDLTRRRDHRQVEPPGRERAREFIGEAKARGTQSEVDARKPVAFIQA